MTEIKNNKILITLTPVILYFYLIINGILGVKFGKHWDEWIFIKSAADSIKTGVLLPHNYIYPSFCYYTDLISAVIYKIIFGIDDAGSLLADQHFFHYLRCVFVLISSLTVIWVYIISYRITKNYTASLISGLIICSSFEFCYHFRWAVSDCIAVQFVVLSAMFLFLNIDSRDKIILSSFAAGIAAGTKYTGGIAILNIIIFILIILISRDLNFKTAVRYALLLAVFFVLGFFLTTPGAIPEYRLLKSALTFQTNVYTTGHYGHTVESGLDHFIRICRYILFSLFSRNDRISIAVTLLAVIGLLFVVLKKDRLTAGLFFTMLVYCIYVSTFSVMIVRNILYVLPFFAVFASIGFVQITGVFKNRKFGILTGVIIMSMLIYSCSYVVKSTWSIRNSVNDVISKDLDDYIKENSDKDFILSPKVSSRFYSGNYINKEPRDNSYLVFYKNEVPFQLYTANIRGQFIKIIGMDDVNFDYYPTWSGKDRIVIMKYSNASEQMIYSIFKRNN